MEHVIRATIIYLFLFVILRASGNRQFGEITVFDAILLLIIAESTQQALIGEDFSITAGLILISTLVGIDIFFSQLKRWSKKADLILEGVPVLLIDKGTLLKENMKRERVDEGDIMAAARELRGLESLDQVKYAVLERNGTISIIPWR